MKLLARPDMLPSSISKGMHIILLGEENRTLHQVVQQFQNRGVEVSILMENGITVSDEGVKDSLKTIAEQKGNIDGFLYLSSTPDVNEMMPFLFAKHLSRYFHRSDHPSRKAFMVVTSLDGNFGLSGTPNGSPEAGAFTGLVKTLHQEWPWVFTRIIDLAPELESDSMAHQIFMEWGDVDTRLVEVGVTSDSRHTIEFEEISTAEGETAV